MFFIIIINMESLFQYLGNIWRLIQEKLATLLLTLEALDGTVHLQIAHASFVVER